MAYVRDLKGSRRDLAVVLSDDWRTAHEAAEAMGRPTGSIFGVLRRMHADALLKADTDPEPPTRGTQYRLSDVGQEALRQALAEEGQVGQLTEGRRVLFIELRKNLASAAKVLGDRMNAGLIDWGAELPTGWLLTLVEGADPHRVRLLRTALEQAGCRCRDIHIDALVTGSLLRKRAERLTNVEDTA